MSSPSSTAGRSQLLGGCVRATDSLPDHKRVFCPLWIPGSVRNYLVTAPFWRRCDLRAGCVFHNLTGQRLMSALISTHENMTGSQVGPGSLNPGESTCVCFQGGALLVARPEQANAARRPVSSTRGDVSGGSVSARHQPAAQTLVHPHGTWRHGSPQELGARRPHRQVNDAPLLTHQQGAAHCQNSQAGASGIRTRKCKLFWHGPTN